MATQYLAKHKLVYSELRQLILEGKLTAGQRIPPDDELAQQHGCGRGTVRRAVQSLIEEGLLRGQQGSGTFVQSKPREAFVGIIVGNLTNPDFSQLVSAVTKAAALRGHTALLAVVEEGHEGYERVPLEWQFIEKMGQMHVAGVIKCPTQIPIEDQFRKRLAELKVPFAIVNDFWTDCTDANHILRDEQAAMRMIVNHLVELGHRRIAYYTPGGLNCRQRARAAFVQQLAARKLATDLIFEIDREEFAGQIAGMPGPAQPTAIISPYSPYALWLIDDFERLGVRVPQDISIASLDNVPIPAITRQDLTSTMVPMDVVADQLLKMLLDLPQNVVSSFKSRFLFSPELHVGNTTAAPRVGNGNARLASTGG